MFYEIFKIYLTTTNLGHHGHMTWYILNILDNIPSQDVLVTSVWYILNVLNICWFGMLLVLRPRPYNVLAMYQVGTSPLAPGECTELGKLKTHGQYIKEIWDILNVFQKY